MTACADATVDIWLQVQRKQKPNMFRCNRRIFRLFLGQCNLQVLMPIFWLFLGQCRQVCCSICCFLLRISWLVVLVPAFTERERSRYISTQSSGLEFPPKYVSRNIAWVVILVERKIMTFPQVKRRRKNCRSIFSRKYKIEHARSCSELTAIVSTYVETDCLSSYPPTSDYTADMSAS